MTTMTQDEYRNERIIGHHLSATRQEFDTSSFVEAMARELEIEPRRRPDRVHITEGDVDWESTSEVTITTDELREMALMFTSLREPQDGK